MIPVPHLGHSHLPPPVPRCRPPCPSPSHRLPSSQVSPQTFLLMVLPRNTCLGGESLGPPPAPPVTVQMGRVLSHSSATSQLISHVAATTGSAEVCVYTSTWMMQTHPGPDSHPEAASSQEPLGERTQVPVSCLPPSASQHPHHHLVFSGIITTKHRD